MIFAPLIIISCCRYFFFLLFVFYFFAGVFHSTGEDVFTEAKKELPPVRDDFKPADPKLNLDDDGDVSF